LVGVLVLLGGDGLWFTVLWVGGLVGWLVGWVWWVE